MKFMKWIDDLLLGRKPKDEFIKSRDLGNGWYEVNDIMVQSDSHAEAVNKYRKARNEVKKKRL